MFIKRIKAIANIGGFDDLRKPGLEFGSEHDMTIVLGRNTIGKTTLAELLASVGSNSTSQIDHRDRIPHRAGTSRRAEFSYVNTGTSEQSAILTTTWTSNDLRDHVHVFDEAFIHRNVMSGHTIVHENRENVTSFVLGAEGIDAANNIEQLNTRLRGLRSNLSLRRPSSQSSASVSMDAVDAYARMEVTEPVNEIEERKRNAEAELSRLNDLAQLGQLALAPFNSSTVAAGMSTLLDEIGLTLALSHNEISQSASAVLQQHIDENCHGDRDAFNWIKDGQPFLGTTYCPFCGSDLIHANQELITAYTSAFDDEFQRFDQRIAEEIQTQIDAIGRIVDEDLPRRIDHIITEMRPFSQFVDGVEAFLDSAISLREQIVNARTAFASKLQEWRVAQGPLWTQKQRFPHRPVSVNSFNEFALQASSEYVVIVDQVGSRFEAERARVANEQLRLGALSAEDVFAAQERCRHEIDGVNRVLIRITEEEMCRNYLEALQEIVDLESELGRLRAEFATTQSSYLSSYFDRVNHYFTRLGSGDFTISVTQNNRGIATTLSLKVSFRGEVVPEDRIPRLLSESDKRSLALAIFLAKIERITTKQDHIIVFDDPVTSFDDNRISQTIIILNELVSSFGQVIILTHYINVVAYAHRANRDFKFFELVPSANGTDLVALDARLSSIGAHARRYEEIAYSVSCGGIGGQQLQLRPFMEEHLRLVFQHQIASMDPRLVFGLENLINELESAGFVQQSVAINLNTTRSLFNAPHHTTEGAFNPLSWKLDAEQLLRTLYEDL